MPITARRTAAGALPPLLAFSHLRWGFVRHRSHHLLSRLAQHGLLQDLLHAWWRRAAHWRGGSAPVAQALVSRPDGAA